MIEPQLFCIPDAARVLNLNPATVRSLVRTGAIKSVRVGGRQMVSRATLDAIIAGDKP
jgi:excisionase family DNA binding protein